MMMMMMIKEILSSKQKQHLLGKYVGQQIEVICITNVSLEANHVPLSPSFQAFSTQSSVSSRLFLHLCGFFQLAMMVMNNGLVDHFLEVIDKDEPAKPPYYPTSFLPTTSKTLNCLLELDGQIFTLNKCLKNAQAENLHTLACWLDPQAQPQLAPWHVA